jgi:cation transport regulator ChaB
MPKTNTSGAANKDELPSTLQRSPDKAQRTFAKTYDSAVEQYGDESRAARTAYAAVKHGFEKVGDHWEPKDEQGPSDTGGRGRRDDTAGGVDTNASKKHLYELAQRLDVSGRSSMNKAELVEALDKANQRESARARKG